MKIIIVSLLISAAASAQTAAFPSAIAADANLKVMVNGMQTTLNGTLSSTATSFAVNACGTIPANSLATVDQEIIAVASCSFNSLSVATTAPGCTNGRGCDNTVPAAHVTGALLSLFMDSWHHNSLRVEVEAIETALGVNLANVLASPGGNVSVSGTLGVTGMSTLTGGVTIGTAGLTSTGQATITVAGGGANGAVITVSSSNDALEGINNGTGYALVGAVVNGTAAIHGISTGSGLAGQFTGGLVSIDTTSGIVIKNGTPPTVAASQVGLGAAVGAASACGSLAGAAGCWNINIAGTIRFIPYY